VFLLALAEILKKFYDHFSLLVILVLGQGGEGIALYAQTRSNPLLEPLVAFIRFHSLEESRMVANVIKCCVINDRDRSRY
jgi:hypothetical protein